MIKDEKYGLVLTGGGTKGAFQVGVWRAIKELNIKIEAIAGTSIGALNGALFLQDDMAKVEHIYENITINNVLELKKKINAEKNIFNISNLANLTIDYLGQRGLGNRPLKELMEENLDIDKIYNSDIDFGLVTYSLNTRTPEKLFKKDIPKDKMIDYLLASACFPVFKAQKIGENEYFDGGLYDNTPINLLIERGCKNIIVADITGIGFNRKIEEKDVYIKVISPSEFLGGTFDFNKDMIRRNIKLGYLDAMRAFNEFQGHTYYFKNEEFIKLLEKFNLNTIYGLEYAARIYNIDRYRLYTCDEFLQILNVKHQEAEKKYAEIKENLNFKAVWKSRSELNKLFDKGLGVCLVKDFYMDKPASSRLKYAKHYLNDYLESAKALIELQNYVN